MSDGGGELSPGSTVADVNFLLAAGEGREVRMERTGGREGEREDAAERREEENSIATAGSLPRAACP